MSTDRRPELSELFHAAVARDPATRAAFLSDACRGDPALQSELERLLAAHGDAGSFLEAPVGAPAGVRRLSPGASVGAYCITQFIGAGGMGDIYRARDARLGRDVAIKILPAYAAADAERRTRFTREAHAIAALNHPNIVTIHSVEQSEDFYFLTMELVEGKTLRELITSGGLPVDRVLQIAIPLADAIGTAHAHGIIHRDLKPANVMVTPEGRVKVLDFGLAKLKAPEPVAPSVTTMPAREITDDGRVLGTVAYMSPEQAEGRDVDPRTDIFSLGVLLFEVATGRRPFTGDSNVSLVSSILKDVPPSVTELRPELPQELGRLIRRCLAKEPSRRYQSALDLRNALEELRQDQESAATAHVAAGATRSRPRRTVWLAGALMALAIFAGAAYLAWPRPADGPPPPLLITRTTLQPPLGVRVAAQDAALILAISPDGQWVAFEGVRSDPNRRGLYLRSISELESSHVYDVDGSSPFFSPDSKWLGFWANNTIWKVPVAGGKPEPICDVPEELRGASWGDDAAIVFTARGQLWRVPATGGTSPTPIKSLAAGKISYFFPHVLPGSKAALVMLLEERKIAIVSLQTGAIIRRLFEGATPQYTQDGFLIFRSGEILYSAPFDVKALKVTGPLLPVLTGVSYNSGGSETSAFGVSRTGALVYMTRERPSGTSPVPGAEDAEAELVWLDGTGRTQPAVDERHDYSFPALDPGGRRVAVHVGSSGDRDVWVYNLSSKHGLRLTTGFRTHGPIVWSSDGHWVVFSANTIPKLFRIRAEGGGGQQPEQLTSRGSASGTFENAYDFPTSARNNLLMFHRQVSSDRFDLLTLLLEPRGEPTPFLESGFRTWNGRISPDGRWVAYESTEAGGRQVFVRSFAEPNRSRWPVANDAVRPYWTRDGRSLRYARNDEIWAVPVSSDRAGREIRFGAPALVIKHPLLAQPDGGGGGRRAVTPSPDGQRFLLVKRSATERLLVYAPNWVAEVKDAMRRSSTSAK